MDPKVICEVELNTNERKLSQVDCAQNAGKGWSKRGDEHTVIYHQLKRFNRPHAQSQLEENICAVSNTSLYCPSELRQVFITELKIDRGEGGGGRAREGGFTSEGQNQKCYPSNTSWYHV